MSLNQVVRRGAFVGGMVGVGLVGSLLYDAVTEGEPRDEVTVRYSWARTLLPDSLPATYEWAARYRVRLYLPGLGRWDSNIRGLVAAGTTQDTSVALVVERPHPMDSLFVYLSVRAMVKRGLPGPTLSGPELRIEGHPDSVVVHRVLPDGTTERADQVPLLPSQTTTFCMYAWKYEKWYLTTCPIPLNTERSA